MEKSRCPLKDGKISSGKKILIDGQQRITAIQAVVVGQQVVDSTYKKKRITIAFNPIDEVFEVCNPAIEKDGKWIPDITQVFDVSFNAWEFVNNYCQINGLDGKQPEINKTLHEADVYQRYQPRRDGAVAGTDH